VYLAEKTLVQEGGGSLCGVGAMAPTPHKLPPYPLAFLSKVIYILY
jgi:hypothetical protein